MYLLPGKLDIISGMSQMFHNAIVNVGSYLRHLYVDLYEHKRSTSSSLDTMELYQMLLAYQT